MMLGTRCGHRPHPQRKGYSVAAHGGRGNKKPKIMRAWYHPEEACELTLYEINLIGMDRNSGKDFLPPASAFDNYGGTNR